jgi:endonuclease/exonuclease/phosphatase family metal-dependent hydrolase
MQVHAITYNIHGLPWSRAPLEKIAVWCLEQRVPILCFQEVFTEAGRSILQTYLERNGYRVLIPHDAGVSLFPSGLLTAIDVRQYDILGHTFQPFLHYHNVEIFSNKGFHRITLRLRGQNKIAATAAFHIINTHTQSDEEVFVWTRYSYKKEIRYKQAEQILEACKELRDPVIVIGDFNQESSLHPHLRTLHPPSSLPLKKATFFRTGEDLDHVAWMPLQWSSALGGCGFCGSYGPQLEYCKIHNVTWSDHAPVEVKVRVGI